MSILFKNSNHHRHPAFGQMLEISLCCYVKGLELNQKDIYIEWQDIRFLWDDYGNCIGGFKTPTSDILPFHFVNKPVSTDITIDLGQPNSLYSGCEPIISKNGCRVKPCQNYIKEYLKRNKDLPEIKLNNYYKDYNKPFVLLHYRSSPKTNQQIGNVDSIHYIKLIKYIRKNHKLDIYKIGEPSQFDSLCDRVYGYFLDDISTYFKLVNDCSLYLGSPSGPWIVPIYFRKSMISLIKDDRVYQREMNGIGSIFSNNQQMFMVNNENYKKMEKMIDNI